MPQTREHFDICRLLRIKSGLVALTKSDLVDAELRELARAEVEDFVSGSFLDGAPIIAVSSRTGEGIDELKGALVQLASEVEPKRTSAVPRLPVDRAFSIRGFGTVVTGTLIAGELKVGDEVEVLPAGVRTRVRNVQVHGHDTELALAGQRTAVNLQGLSVEQGSRGSMLVPAGRLRSTAMFDARLELLKSSPRPLAQRARIRLHHGTAEVMARVVMLAEERAGAPEEDQGYRSRYLNPGESRLVQLRLESSLSVLPGDRFIIRSYSPQVTIGGGVIIDALPDKHRLRDKDTSARLERLENADLSEQSAVFIEMAGARAMTAGELAARTGATDTELARTLAKLVETRRAMEVSASPLILISSQAHDALAARVLELLGEHHRKEPLALGINREEVRERVFGTVRPEIFKTIIGRLSEDGKVAAERDTLRLASHRPELSAGDSAAKERLESSVKAAGLQAGTLEEIASSAGVPIELARKLYNLLAASGRVLRIGEMLFHAESIENLKLRVRARRAVSPRMDVAVFKEITGGLTRKHAIPLLEYLDRERITRRVGNEREIL
jgi:selenocysteine-specific elongation factor